MNEKDLLEQLKQSAETITPPESLSPDEMEKMLKAMNGHSEPPRKPKKKISVYRLGGLAAAFAVAIIGSWTAGRYSISQNTVYSDEAVSDILADITESAPDTGDEAIVSTSVQEASGAANAEPATENPDAAAEMQNTDAEKPNASIEIPEADTEKLNTSTEKLDTGTTELDTVTEKLDTADSYETLYETLWQNFGGGSDYYGTDILYVTEDTIELAAEESADMGQMARYSAASGSTNSEAGSSYSKTNIQEEGVDEADLVKTDGKYIYVLKRTGSLIILAAKEGDMEIMSSIDIPSNESVYEMYVDGSCLSFITSGYYTEMEDSDENVIAARSGTRTKLYTYDISDRKNPVLSGTVTQDGSYSQSRKNGDYIYLFSQFSPIIQDTYEDSFLVPRTSSGEVAASSIYLPENLNYSTYLVVSSVNIHNPGETVNQKAVVSVASTFYAGTENIYIANETWTDGTTRTELLKLHYADGIITGTAAGSLEGYLNDSFSLNEYNGYLRAVTTSYDENYNERNGLYILDEDLQLTGAIRDLAPDETIRSARFLGDTAYFVTFRQTDPLFSVDLSDPSDPKILGDLKITGFSSYLHFYSEDLLLGLGYEADPKTGIQTGIKLSMVDISDPSNVTEISKFVLDGITWCEALDNYKSILIDPEKNIFGFTCDNRYLVFSYDEEQGFISEFIYDFYNDMLNGYNGSSNNDTRGLYIDDTLYLVRPDVVNAFDMTDSYRKIGQYSIS